MNDRHEKRLVTKAQELYRRQADALSPDVTRRLTMARREALTQMRAPHWSRLWVPAGAVAAGLLAVAVVQIRDPGADQVGLPALSTAAEDMEILFDGEDLDLLSDLEFYAWLGTDVDAG